MVDNFVTFIIFRGSTKDIKDAIKEILKHNNKYKDIQINSINLNYNSTLIKLNNYSEKDLDRYIENHNNDILISCISPHGYFAYLEEFPLFKNLSKISNNLEFEGCSEGYNTLGYQQYTAMYKNGKLNLKFNHSDVKY